ncbi:MAG: peptidylprolyl isomerase [Ignavibacteriales bacterium]|nr:peptidylprolyl isomerase [Ignavibacteriales bacterium]
MKMISMMTLSIMMLRLPLFSQTPNEQRKTEEESRREKIELILRFQDTRTIFDGKLISFFNDNDPLIRERTVRAFGSIQDTSVLNLLVDRLTDVSPNVQDGAAFAIGQTAGQLNRSGRERLEHDLIWNRLEKMNSNGNPSPQDRMIEEMGKFGTEQALTDLVARFGNVYPPVHANALIMSVARFGIRGITSREAVQFLLKLIKPPDAAQWRVVYALQRIGNRQEIRDDLEHIVQLYKNADPLVRMNLAILMGKVKDERICLEPLQKLADFDGDWRVRVNALRALSNYGIKGRGSIIDTYRRSFYNDNMYIALTALTSFGNTGLTKNEPDGSSRESFAAMEQIAVNKGNEYRWQLQAEAATAMAKLEGRSAMALIDPTAGSQLLLHAQLLTATGITGAPEALHILSQYLDSDQEVLARAALEGLQELSKKNPTDSAITQATYNACLVALRSDDVARITTAASILGDSLFLRLTSLTPLIEALNRSRIPDDVEAIQEITATLGKLKDLRAIDALEQVLKQRDRSVVLASASALKSITGKDHSAEVPDYFEPIFADLDFQYLRSLPDSVRVKLETSRGDVVMELYKEVAPFTVMSFLKLATQRGFYRGLSFHRVVPNFVVQGGDPRGDGWGGPGYSIRSEFSPLTYETGSVGIASAGKDTEGSQFFITQSPQPHLDGRYTIFGKVVSGMDVVDRIQVDDHIFDVKIIP